MNQKKTIPTLIVLGSGEWIDLNIRIFIQLWSIGGHTTEMFRLLSGIDLNVYKPRHYTIASTDKMSAKKMNEFDENVRIDFLFI
jgi:hypothetical protein